MNNNMEKMEIENRNHKLMKVDENSFYNRHNKNH